MSDQPFNVSVLPGLPPPGSILVIRGADFGDEEADYKANRAIVEHYANAARLAGVESGTPASDVLPLILRLPPEGEAIIWDEEAMEAAGWVRKP